MNLIYKGSVKDIYEKGSNLVFQYSHRYSVFDWGEMPDEIPQKGEALAIMAGLFFEYLREKGVDSHFLAQEDSDAISVRKMNVLRPAWEEGRYLYSMYQSQPQQTLVPLEVIFRLSLGQGNSLEGRLKKNPAYLKDLGLSEIPPVQQRLTSPIVEFSTKLEDSDRYLTQQELREMDVVTEGELRRMRETTESVALLLENLFSSFGVQLWDGKFEFAFGNKNANGERDLILVDSIGPDELRLTYEGLPLSKEFLRQLYVKTPWYSAVQKSKEIAKDRGSQDWKGICRTELQQEPPKLDTEEIAVASLLYKSIANEVAVAMGRERPFEPEANLKAWREKCKSLL